MQGIEDHSSDNLVLHSEISLGIDSHLNLLFSDPKG